MAINMTPIVNAAASVARAVAPVVKAGAAEFGKTAVQCAAVTAVTFTMYGGAFASYGVYKKWHDRRASIKAVASTPTAEAPAPVEQFHPSFAAAA